MEIVALIRLEVAPFLLNCDFTLLKGRLREAARIFRESKISNEKSNFFYFAKTSFSVNYYRKNILKFQRFFFSG